jgi:hypothetical protein
MELIRYKAKDDTVFGILYDVNWNCGTYHTVERLSKMIPEGAYWIMNSYSPKFNRRLPLVYGGSIHKNRGIRIHAGNSVVDTNGCILIGNTSNLVTARIGDSARAVEQLVKAIGNGINSLFVRNEI